MSTTTFNLNAPWLVDLTIKDFGVDLDSACAVWGNAGHESGGFENLQEDKPLSGKGGYGYFQFTGPRRTAFFDYCKRNGYSPNDPMANYKWFFIESKTTEPKWIAAVKRAVGLDNKVKAFELAYERAHPNYKHYPSRIEWAKKAKEVYLKYPERRQVPERYKESQMTVPIEIKPVNPLASKGVVGGIVAAILGVGAAFFPWMAGLNVDTTTNIIMILLGLGSSLSGVIAAIGRIKAVNPIAGTEAEAKVRARYEAALETPAPGQYEEAQSQQFLNPFEMMGSIFKNEPIAKEKAPAAASLSIGTMISAWFTLQRIMKEHPEMAKLAEDLIPKLLDMLKKKG